MTGKDLFIGLSFIDQKYIEEAEQDTLHNAPELTFTKPKAGKRPRFLLIAAIIVLSLLLVGCVAAVFIGLQQRTIGVANTTSFQDKNGNKTAATEVTRDVITFFGYTGTPHYQAMQEWYRFTESYDPDLELMTNTNELGIPENYWLSYYCYTWEMAEQLESICHKYGLKPLGSSAVIQNWDEEIFYDALQLESLLRPDSGMDITSASGYFYPEGDFHLSIDLHPTGQTPRWKDTIWATVMYSGKELFHPAYSTIQSEIYEEWLYTTTAGVDITIAMRENGAILFAERQDAYITITVSTDSYDQKTLRSKLIWKPSRNCLISAFSRNRQRIWMPSGNSWQIPWQPGKPNRKNSGSSAVIFRNICARNTQR